MREFRHQFILMLPVPSAVADVESSQIQSSLSANEPLSNKGLDNRLGVSATIEPTGTRTK